MNYVVNTELQLYGAVKVRRYIVYGFERHNTTKTAIRNIDDDDILMLIFLNILVDIYIIKFVTEYIYTNSWSNTAIHQNINASTTYMLIFNICPRFGADVRLSSGARPMFPSHDCRFSRLNITPTYYSHMLATTRTLLVTVILLQVFQHQEYSSS